MINCLQDELIKVRLREAENEESIRNLGEKVSELEEVCIFFRLFCFKAGNVSLTNVNSFQGCPGPDNSKVQIYCEGHKI